MRLISTMTAALFVAVTAGPVLGQTALDKLENKLKGPVVAAPATPAAPAYDPTAPGSGYLGVVADDTPEPGKGVIITGVKKGAPSEAGGLKEGDIILSIDGKPCRNLDDLDAVLAKGKVGTKLTMTLQRLGKQESKVITLGRRPSEPAATDTPAAPAASGTKRPADPLLLPPARSGAPPTLIPPTPAPPAADPAAVPPTLKPAADPLAKPGRDPALELPAPPAGEKPAADPLALPATEKPGAESPTPESPLPGAAAAGKASLGISVVPLNDETRAAYDVRTSARQGALIVGIRPGSPADSSGLPLLGVIVSIDGQLVKGADELIGAVAAARPGQEVELRYMVGDKLATKTVRLGPAASAGFVPATPRPGLTLGTPDRPLLRKFEDMIENLGPPEKPSAPVGSTIMDPARVAEMYQELKALTEKVQTLEKRVKALETKVAPVAPAPNP